MSISYASVRVHDMYEEYGGIKSGKFGELFPSATVFLALQP